MELTPTQKQDIKDYIFIVPKYRETINELYDHILNALKDIDAPFSLTIVDDIVWKDFGGYQAVFDNEKLYRNVIGKRYIKYFNLEILNTFKWPGIIYSIVLVLLCLLIYFYYDITPYDFKIIFAGITIWCILFSVFMHFKIFRNRIKYKKYSILDEGILNEASVGILIMFFMFQLFIAPDSFVDTSPSIKLIINLFLFFLASLYFRAFIKFYNQKLKVLGI